jgi:hypothetical protein
MTLRLVIITHMLADTGKLDMGMGWGWKVSGGNGDG